MAAQTTPTKAFPPQTGVIALIGAGRRAFREVKGLRAFLVKGFLLNYAVFVVVGLVVMGLGWAIRRRR